MLNAFFYRAKKALPILLDLIEYGYDTSYYTSIVIL